MKLTIAFPVIILITLFTIQTVAQKTSLGFRGGLTIPNLTNGGSQTNPLNEGYSSRSGLGFGVFVDFKINKTLSFQPMIEYSQQGGKKDGFQAFPVPPEMAAMFGPQAPPYLYADFKSVAKINYLLIPLLVKNKWSLGSKSLLHLYLAAGPFAGFLLDAHQVTSGSSPVYADEGKTQPIPANPQDPSAGILTLSFNNTQNIKDDLHKFNYGIEGNLGLSYQIKKCAIFIEGGGNYGFLNIQKGSANGKNHTGAATVMLGYAYSL